MKQSRFITRPLSKLNKPKCWTGDTVYWTQIDSKTIASFSTDNGKDYKGNVVWHTYKHTRKSMIKFGHSEITLTAFNLALENYIND